MLQKYKRMFYDVYKQVFLYKIERGGNFVLILDENNIQVVMGSGDITIKTGCIGSNYPGVIQFLQKESLMDQNISANEIIKIDEAPVSLVFNNVESMDTVINQLLKLRKTMGGN